MTMDEIQRAIDGVDDLIDLAKLILKSAPYRTYVPEEQYIRLSYDGDDAIVTWPESHSGYYDSCSIEEQSARFPLALLLKSDDEINAWAAEQQRVYDERQRAESARQAQIAADNQRAHELNLLAHLKKKYEEPKA